VFCELFETLLKIYLSVNVKDQFITTGNLVSPVF